MTPKNKFDSITRGGNQQKIMKTIFVVKPILVPIFQKKLTKL